VERGFVHYAAKKTGQRAIQELFPGVAIRWFPLSSMVGWSAGGIHVPAAMDQLPDHRRIPRDQIDGIDLDKASSDELALIRGPANSPRFVLSRACSGHTRHGARQTFPETTKGAVKFGEVFDNQALNPILNYAVRSAHQNLSSGVLVHKFSDCVLSGKVIPQDARLFGEQQDIAITDPPYADAINYHEITEYFIVWLRASPPAPFDQWTWDSRRDLSVRLEATPIK
jgi:hypothetical protein